MLHIAAQNNQRKAAKLVLKRTDFATDPPRLSLIDAQTSAGHTALHFAFAYGYKDLGKYLLSLGADDTVANVHGMTCYEGLDPDEPPRDCLNTPEMRELARSKELRRRVDAMRPGAGAGAGGAGIASSRGGTITHPLGRPSGVAGLARDSGAFTARGRSVPTAFFVARGWGRRGIRVRRRVRVRGCVSVHAPRRSRIRPRKRVRRRIRRVRRRSPRLPAQSLAAAPGAAAPPPAAIPRTRRR